MLVIFLVLNLLDAHNSTYLFVKEWGIEAETANTGRWFMKHFGTGLIQLCLGRIAFSILLIGSLPALLFIVLITLKKALLEEETLEEDARKLLDSIFMPFCQLGLITWLAYWNFMWIEAVIHNYRAIV